MHKLLVLSAESWDDTNSGGNTYSNLFSGLDNVEFSNIFCRTSVPNNRICEHYFRITDKMLLKYALSPSKIGTRFEYSFSRKDNTQKKVDNADKEKKLIFFIHKYNLKFAYFLEGMLWRFKGWQNKKLDEFLQEQNPDIIFCFAIPTVQKAMLIDYVKKKTGAKLVLMIVDHVCRDFFFSDGKKGKARAKRMQKILSAGDKIYAITDELKDTYSRQFNVDISVLRKACTFDTEIRQSIGDPIKMVYAGNLHYGRLDILAKLAENIKRINANGEKILLDIYSATPISEDDEARLQIPGASVFHGARLFDEIKELLSDADIVLHVESFEPQQVKIVKYSFSTKITDALESGRNFMCIGPSGISSVEYAKRIPGATVIDNLDDIGSALNELVSNKESLLYKMQKTREFALKNHSSDVILPEFYNQLLSLLQE